MIETQIQSEHIGIYQAIYNMNDGAQIKYTLTLNENGTFNFHFYRKLICEGCIEENNYGRGTWFSDQKLIYFKTLIENDLNENYKLNFQNSKARFDRKSSRNKSQEIVPDRLRFYEPEIFWVEGTELTRI
ncbi:hypothetical protein A9Q87_08280 [Flavobacteriales bacterium 34_180_T64]|nr:hypothetical protein A9Q87_08280 [Flavobacteriales bacterium 34_180_T64]